MAKKIILSALFCLIAVSALAASKDFDQFSLDMSGGWTLMSEPIKNQGTMLVILANEAKQSAVNIAIAPTNGEDAKALGEATQKNMAAQGAKLKVVESGLNRSIFEGKQGNVDVRVYLLADPGNKVMAAIILTGDVKEAEALIKTVKFKNSKLSLS